MIARTELESVVGRESRPGHHVLSVYLDVNESQAARLARGFEPALRNLLRSAEQEVRDDSERKAFGASADRVLRFMADYTPGAPSVVMFCDHMDGFFWHREFRVPVRNVVRWSRMPYGRPLMETLDEYERYSVILADRAKARLFTVFLGEIEEKTGTLAPDDVRRYRKVGTDQMRSQMSVQRRAEHHSHWHLKNVAETLDRMAAGDGFDRLVLAGPVEATSELQRLLSRRLQSRLARSISLPVGADQQQVIEAILAIEQEIEREAELQLVRELTVTAVKNPQAAVVGDQATLRALQAGRVWKLVYAEGFTSDGGRCKGCGALFASPRATCGYCGAEVTTVADLTDRLVECASAFDGRVKMARGAAADQLRAHGGIGAFLRF